MPKEVNLNLTITVFEEFSEIEEQYQKLILISQKMCDNAYAPYSNFYVGAAILLENGEVVTGSNQENAAYPSGLCAERTAVYWAGSQYPNVAIEAIAIAARRADEQKYLPISPCGSCRQALLEYENKQDTPIKFFMGGSNGKFYLANSIEMLLPLKFTIENLHSN